ncbi:MAG: protein kinase [Kofleriaceae bacterium]
MLDGEEVPTGTSLAESERKSAAELVGRLAITLSLPRAPAATSAGTAASRADAASPADEARGLDEVRFVEQRELGRGGMGRVALARDRYLSRDVAIKQALEDDDAHQARFAREVRLTARLEHPSIAPVHDAGFDDLGRPYYIMRRIEGQELESLAQRAPDIAARLALVPNVLAAVDAAAYAHAHGILHRDIKPANILVGRYGETWLIDWGLARELEGEAPEGETPAGRPDDDHHRAKTRAGGAAAAAAERDSAGLTRYGEMIGTPGFIAPEQARGEPVSAAADVYSLGATLAYVLTGALLYPERTATALLAKARAGHPIELPATARAVPAALLAIVRRATSPEPRDRYPAATELAADLRRFSTGQLVAAYRYSPAERLLRLVARHRALVALAAAALAVVATIATLSVRRVLRERDRATAAERAAVSERARAEQRSEQLLLQRARALAAERPDAALATLKLLPPQSGAWRMAWGVARQAAAAGTSRMLGGHRAAVHALAFAPGGAQLASGDNDGLVLLHDLQTHRTRELAREVGFITAVRWLSDHRLAYTTESALILLDLERGAARRIDVGAQGLHVVAKSALRYTVDHTIYELELEGSAPPRPLLHDVSYLAGSQAGTLVQRGRAGLVLIDRAGATRSIPIPTGAAPHVAELDDAGARLAYADAKTVREYDLRGRPRLAREWAHQGVVFLSYTKSQLCMSSSGSSWITNTDTGLWNAAFQHNVSLRFAASNPKGCTFVQIRDEVTLVLEGRRHTVRIGDEPFLAGAVSPRSASFAISRPGGRIEVWPMEGLPTAIPFTATSATIRGVSKDSFYVHEFVTLRQIDRATGEVRELPDYRGAPPLFAAEAPPGLLVSFQNVSSELVIVDLTSRRELTVLDRVTAATPMDRPDRRWLIARDNQLAIFDPQANALTNMLKLDEPALVVGQLGDAAVVRTAAAILRVNLVTRSVERLDLREVPDATDALAIDPRGTCWLGTRDGLFRWDGAAGVRVALSGATTRVFPHRWLGVVAVDRGGQVSLLDHDGRLLRSFAAASNVAISPHQPFAAWLLDDRRTIVLADLFGGDRLELPSVGDAPLLDVMIDDDGALIVTGLMEHRIYTFPPLVPPRPESLPTWVANATNAEVTLESPEPRWVFAPIEGPAPKPPAAP